MEALLYFVIWAAIIFLMMRFGCGAHVMGHDRGKAEHAGRDAEGRGAENLRWIPPAKDVDPVCGKTVDTDRAKASVYDGSIYYFCSRECREIFETAPEQYVGSQASGPLPQLEDSHV